MSDVPMTEYSSAPDGNRHTRRALIVANISFDAALEEQLTAAGYAVRRATSDHAAQVIKEFTPDVALIALGGDDESETDAVALARRLRARPESYALPLVFLYQRDERNLRSAALQIGVDDYFSISKAANELSARLDALFWRAAAGRRHAPIVAEQRSEIDNFLLLLDAVRADAESGTKGALALVSDAQGGNANLHGAAAERLLAEVHGFFKLQLRRMDAVAFYGPTILLVYMPHHDSTVAQETLARLREQFLETRAASDIAIGLASFPTDGVDVEKLVERAETTLHTARMPDAPSRVVAYGVRDSAGAKQASGKVAVEAPAERASATEKPAPGIDPAQNLRETKARPVREKMSHGEPEAAVTIPTQAGASGSADGKSALSGAALEAGMRERERRASGAAMPRRLLLTVSDAARMAQLNLLIRSAGYEVRAAFDGQQALNLLRIERPDLLLVDFDLHDMDGMEMLRRLRKQSGGHVKLPVVLLLPAQHASVHDEALETGARHIIMMPCEPSDLLDSVRAAGTHG